MEKNDRNKKILDVLDKVTITFELIIGFLLLVIIAVKFLDLLFDVSGLGIVLLDLDFKKILAAVFNLVIGVEFVRMLYKHTPEAVIYVLLFATARYIILNYEGIMHLMAGVLSIAGLFAVKRFLIKKRSPDNS